MSAALHDAEAREAITARLADNLFVEAGAGTGKTQSLVDRVVCLVAEGTSLSQVAAITFTDAAAAELRERIRRELERAARRRIAPAPPPCRARAVRECRRRVR